MSTTYNPNVPNPPDMPSVDVFSMQTNTASLSNWCGLYDHYGLNNVPNTGLHQQVTFGAANVPGSAPTDPTSILYTKTDSNGKPQLYFLNSQNGSYITIGSNGSITMFAGIILKWGFYTEASPLVFSSLSIGAFPNNLFNVQLTSYATGTQFDVTGSLSKTQFTFSPAIPGGAGFFFFAIGN